MSLRKRAKSTRKITQERATEILDEYFTTATEEREDALRENIELALRMTDLLQAVAQGPRAAELAALHVKTYGDTPEAEEAKKKRAALIEELLAEIAVHRDAELDAGSREVGQWPARSAR